MTKGTLVRPQIALCDEFSGPARNATSKSRRLIRSLILVISVFVIISVAGGCGTTTAVYPPIRSVAFAGENEVWAVLDSNQGELVRLIDGRVNKVMVSKGEPIRLVSRYANSGWGLDGAGQVWSTEDGGNTWSARGSLGATVNGVSDQMAFLNEKDGWIQSAGEMFSTNDSGRTWKKILFFEGKPGENFFTDGLARQSFFLDRNRIWVVTPSGRVVISGDGGNSWQRYSFGAGFEPLSLSVVTDKEAWVSTVGPSGVLQTLDGGRTWKNRNVTVNGKMISVDALSFQDSNVGWALGSQSDNAFDTEAVRTNIALTTVDGGRNWRPLFSTKNDSLKVIRMMNSQTGWLVSETTVFRTIDGGETWTKLFSVSANGQTTN